MNEEGTQSLKMINDDLPKIFSPEVALVTSTKIVKEKCTQSMEMSNDDVLPKIVSPGVVLGTNTKIVKEKCTQSMEMNNDDVLPKIVSPGVALSTSTKIVKEQLMQSVEKSNHDDEPNIVSPCDTLGTSTKGICSKVNMIDEHVMKDVINNEDVFKKIYKFKEEIDVFERFDHVIKLNLLTTCMCVYVQ